MPRSNRAGFSATELLVIIAAIGILVGFLMVAVMKARLAAGRIESVNNLKQIALACHTYHDAVGNFPAGNDKNNYSAHAHLLPYIEEVNLQQMIDFTKPVDDKANNNARARPVKIYRSPLDPQMTVREDAGPTNYLFCAGAKPGLKNNNGVFHQESAVTLGQITNGDGTTNTLLAAETLKGDGGTKAVDVRRQHVMFTPEKPKEPAPVKVDAAKVKAWIADLSNDKFEVRQKATEELAKLGEAVEADLKKAYVPNPNLDLAKRVDELLKRIEKTRQERLEGALAGLKEDSGMQDWKDSKNIAGDRCASWMDGRFLQGTFIGNRGLNDAKPDVNAGGRGGYSAMRNTGQPTIPVAFCDGHVQNVPVTTKADVWKALATYNGNENVQLP